MASPISAITPRTPNAPAQNVSFLPAATRALPSTRDISWRNADIKKQKMSIKHHHSLRCVYVRHIQIMIINRAMPINNFDLCISSRMFLFFLRKQIFEDVLLSEYLKTIGCTGFSKEYSEIESCRLPRQINRSYCCFSKFFLLYLSPVKTVQAHFNKFFG